MNRYIFTFVISFLSLLVTAQKDSLKLNSIYAELGGTAGHYSVNYDRIIYAKDRQGLMTSIGFAPTLFDRGNTPRFTFSLKYYLQFKKHKFEIGPVLSSYTYDNTSLNIYRLLKNSDFAFFCYLGYKYSINDRFYSGIAITPLLRDDGDYDFMLWGGLNFGYKF